MLLLADLRRIFDEDEQKRTFIPTRELVEELNKMDERPWGKHEKGLTDHTLASLLRRFDVIQMSNGSKRGYHREPGLIDAWARYVEQLLTL